MVVCKYFLQGNCTYGDFCKFEHQVNDNFSIQNKNSTSVLRQPNFNTSQQPKPSTPVGNGTIDINTLVKSVVNDMTVAEKGGQWLLSCYAPYKELPAFPGFEDQSFEEIRYGYYEAMKTGTVEQYKQQIQMVLQQAMLKLKSLQSPSPDIINILKSIYSTPPSSQSGIYGSNTIATSNAFSNTANNSGQQQPSTFNQQSGSSIFAQANQSLFVNKNPQSQNFAGASNIFGGGVAQNTNIFGGQASNPSFNPSNNYPQPQNSNQSIFSQANVNPTGGGSIFGMPSPTSGMLPGTVSMPGNIFNNAQSNSSSVFGGHQMNTSLGHMPQQNPQQIATPFVTQAQTSNMFGKPPTNIFASQNTVSPFAQTPAPQTFGNTMKSPIFDQQNVFLQQNQPHLQASIPPFSQQAKTSLEVVPSQSNIFGNKQPTGGSNLVRSQMEQMDENVYSKLEELTEEERKWFESDDLDILNIPEKPPTYQMCFKT